MGQGQKLILRDMKEFKRIVVKLSKGVNQSDIDWNDAQILKLRASIQTVANASNSVLNTS